MAVPRALLGRDLERIPTRSRVVALTFDAGGDAAGVASILRTLEREKAAATFFLTGRWVRTYPRLARQIAARFPVANHSDTHPDMTRLTASSAGRQIRTAARAIATATGRAPVPLFRFPFGAVNTGAIRTVNANGYACIRWTVDTLGWMGTSAGQSARSVTARVLRAAVPGEIVLMHVGSNPKDRTSLDAAALPAVITGLRARGYRFVTLPAALGL